MVNKKYGKGYSCTVGTYAYDLAKKEGELSDIECAYILTILKKHRSQLYYEMDSAEYFKTLEHYNQIEIEYYQRRKELSVQSK